MRQYRVGRQLVAALFLLPEPSPNQSYVPVAEVINHETSECSGCKMCLKPLHMPRDLIFQCLRSRDQPLVFRSKTLPEPIESPATRIELVQVHVESRERIYVPYNQQILRNVFHLAPREPEILPDSSL